MILSFFCRLTADLAFYFSFANYLLIFAASGSNQPPAAVGAPSLTAAPILWPIALLLASGLLSYLLKTKTGKKSVQALPLFLPCLIFLLSPGRLSLLVMLPPWAYLAYILFQGREQLSYSQYHDRFFWSLKLLPLLILPPLLSFRLDLLTLVQRQILPFVVLYLFCSVLSLRLSRHQQESLGRKSMLLTNLLLLLCFFLLCLSFVYSQVWSLAWQGLTLIYRYLLAPLLLLLAMAIALPFFAVGLLIKFLAEKNPPAEGTPFTQELGEAMSSAFGDGPLGGFPEPLRLLLLFLLLLAFLWVAWRLFRRLAGGPAATPASAAISESRQKLSPSAGQELNLLPPADPRLAVRYYYRKFMRLCQKQGLPLEAGQTSLDIQALVQEQLPSQQAALAELRQLYLPARYDEGNFAAADKEKASKAKSIYRLIKKAFLEKANSR
ncbi:MAG: DUF4129 domain-containing protein [Clostridiales bacterium]